MLLADAVPVAAAADPSPIARFMASPIPMAHRAFKVPFAMEATITRGGGRGWQRGSGRINGASMGKAWHVWAGAWRWGGIAVGNDGVGGGGMGTNRKFKMHWVRICNNDANPLVTP